MVTVECIGCAEQIQERALVCKHCSTRQDDTDLRELRDARRAAIEAALFDYERDEDGDLANIQRLFSLIGETFVYMDVYGIEMAWNPEGRMLEFEYSDELFFLQLRDDNSWRSRAFWLGQLDSWDDEYTELMHPLTPRAIAVLAIRGLTYQMKVSQFLEEDLNERLGRSDLGDIYLHSQGKFFAEDLEHIDRSFLENDRKFWRDQDLLILLESEVEALLKIQNFAYAASLKHIDEKCTEENRVLWVNHLLAALSRIEEED